MVLVRAAARTDRTVGGSACEPSERVAKFGLVPALLRNFLYLDERLTSMYLAQLEGGVYAEEEQSRTESRERTGGASAKLGGAGAQFGRGTSGEQTTTRTVRQTPEAEYRRLEKVLEEEDGVQWLEVFDDAIWQDLKRGELVAVESVMKVPSLYQATEMAASAGPMVDFMRMLGEEIDTKTEEAIEGMSAFGEMLKDVAVVAHAAGVPRFKFVCPLKRDYLREDLDEMDGECVVVGSIQRRLKPTEKYSLLDSLGLGGMPRAERRKAERDMRKHMPDAVVSAPAVILTPLAIYR
jgi:hypothetical protein